MSDSTAFDIARFPVHLGLGATVVREPAFTGMDWYSSYGERHATDGFEGRLVSVYTYTAPWEQLRNRTFRAASELRNEVEHECLRKKIIRSCRPRSPAPSNSKFVRNPTDG